MRPLGLCAMLTVGGCSGGSSIGPGGDAGPDGAADAGGNETFAVSVLLGVDDSPLADVTVALDLRGRRTQMTTDATGLVVFTGLDFGGETASVTAYLADHGVVSYVGRAPSEAALQVRTYRLSDPGGSTDSILGSATSMMDVADRLVATSTAGLELSDDVGPDYEVPVESDTTGTLVAFEYEGLTGGGPRDRLLDVKQWATKSHAAVNGVASLDISFVTDLATPVTVSGSLVLPARTDSPLQTDARGFFGVYSANATMLAGIYETSTLSTDRFNVDGQYLDLGGTFEPLTNYVLRVEDGPETLEQSTVVEFDYPADGFEITNFLDAPEITSSLELHPIHDEITWTHHDASTLTTLRVFKFENDVPVRIWDVYAPGAAESATIPDLPTTADASDVLGDLPLTARVGSCDLDEELQVCVRAASSRTIELLP